MNDVWLVLAFAGVFFGAMALRGVFGYLKNKKIAVEDLKFSWKTFLSGSIRPVLLTLATGALAGLLLAFLKVVGLSGIEVAGLDQISPQMLEIGLAIADVGAIGYAIKEALLCYGLTDKQIEQIRETVSLKADDENTGVKIGYEGAELIAEAVNVKQDAGGGEELDENSHPELGALPYYKVAMATPDEFYNSVNGKGFNEGWGFQCVSGFKEFCYSLCGKYVSTLTGAAKDYANQRNQIEPLGFTYHNDKNLQNGDWVILGLGTYGHVAMYYNGKLFGQNQGASDPNVGTPFNLMSISLNSYLCHYRPNIYVKAPAPTPAPIPTPEPTPEPTSPIKAGDSVIAHGKGYSTANLTGRRTKDFPNTKMKVLAVYPKSAALNQHNSGEIGDLSQTTGFWPLSDLKKA